MASQGARADPVASREESGESVVGSVAPASAGGVEVGREGVGADAPRPPGGAPVVGLPPEYAQIFQMAFQAQAQAKHSYLHKYTHPLQRQCRHQPQPFLQLTAIMKESGRWELQNSRVP
ncbi:UNVERIFIED_CONTAM: hypothetical protein Slati_3844400 [Sesamum latifolium]|uniref:Uncharacterized protein n=1 Tax=Sesamum latifolium TaxID=2727402 RepID=A0AAW2TKH0_9LAMI